MARTRDLARSLVLSASILSGCGIASTAWAQDATPAKPRPQSGATDSRAADNQPGPARTEAALTGDDIVVTAQRRTESLKDVPIAITVVSGDTMRQTGATQLPDIQQFAPSLKYSPVPGAPVFSIRGIGTSSYDYGIESAVGLAIDDVNITLPRYTPVTTLADIDRVEVLRGPQGLLFGKNTTAGLISITTRRPQIGEYSNEGRLQVGSRHQVQVYDIVNLPLGRNAAIRLRGAYQYQDPVLDVRGPGRIEQTRNANLNAKLLWKPTDRLTLYAIGDYQETHGDPGVWTIRSFGTGTVAPAVGNNFVRDQNAKFGIVPGPDNRATAIGAYNFNDTRSRGAQLSIDYDLGGATLTSVTAYRDVQQKANLEVDTTPLPVYDDNHTNFTGHQTSEELRIASSGQRTLDYVAGLYYWNQRIDAHSAQFGTFGYLPASAPFLLSSAGGQVNFDVHSKSYAAFAQGTLHIGPSLRLIGGARYTHDDIAVTAGASEIPGVCSFAILSTGACEPTPLPYSNSETRKKDGWSARAGVEYSITAATNAYFTYSRGYKGPALSSTSVTIYQVNPETVNAYELGLKTELLDHRLNVNIALFQNNFKDFQAQIFDPNIPPKGAFRTGNAGGLRTRGVEAEVFARPTTGFTLSGGITYLDTEIQDYFIPCYAGQTTAQGCIDVGTTAARFDVAGFPLSNAPKWSTSLAAAYEKAVSDGVSVFANADWSYRSSVFFGLGNPNTIEGGYSIVNASLGIGDPEGRIRVSVFARNLFDKRFAAIIFPGYFDAGQSAQILPDAAFRRIGIALDWRL